MAQEQGRNSGSHQLDVIVVGAGFAGLYMLHNLRQRGFSVRILEAGAGVGGTWYWNRYPGARCDVESVEYSYSFSPELEREWRWTERYAAQPEILRYLDHVADRFDLRRDIQLETRVASATWDEGAAQWRVETTEQELFHATYCVFATGNLSMPKLPDWPGLDRFAGEIHHTAQWPEAPIDLAGKRVGVIGTGSSGIQVIPNIAKQVEHLTIFQRTPNFATPARNRPLTSEDIDHVHAHYRQLREKARHSFLGFFNTGSARSAHADSPDQQSDAYEHNWQVGGAAILSTYGDLLIDETANVGAADFVRAKIRSIIKDPETARRMTPTGYPLGGRRLCNEIGYFDAINADNVSLVDVREAPIEQVLADGLEAGGEKYPLDIIIFATGFHAMVGAVSRIDVRGTAGRSLNEEWANGPRTYLGLMVSGFPNLFLVTGPGSPSVLSNVVVSIEHHVEWIAECLTQVRARGAQTIQPDPQAEEAWMTHVDEVASHTLFPRANSWYMGATRDGRKVFMPYVGGVGAYRQTCAEIAADGYRGFLIEHSLAPLPTD